MRVAITFARNVYFHSYIYIYTSTNNLARGFEVIMNSHLIEEGYQLDWREQIR